jgi:hypothetical protein
MIVASLLALATLAAPASAPLANAGYGQDTMRHLKGHPSLPAPAAKPESSAPAVCHPDPGKGRACRHHVSKREQARSEARARAELAANEAASTPR